MQVYGNKDDYHVDKIMIAAEYAKVSMTLISNPLKMEQVQKNNPMACTLPALCTKQGQVLCQSNAILNHYRTEMLNFGLILNCHHRHNQRSSFD